MSEHTALPWDVYESGDEIEIVSNGEINVCSLWAPEIDVARADAEFIVLACNAHDEMVAALELLADEKNWVGTPSSIPVRASVIAREALKKARE